MPNRPRSSSLLAVGPACPAGKHLSMDNLEILKPLACSHNCFITTVRIEQAGADATATAGSTCATAAPLGVAKSYRKAHLDEDEVKQVEVEIKVHHQLTANPHVVPFWAALDTPDSTTILTAHCDGDMRGMIDRSTLTEEAVRSQIAAPMLQVLAEMHSKGFVHRDIKPENIFISGTHAMLGDFGLAIAMPRAEEATQPSPAGAEGADTKDSSCNDRINRLAPYNLSRRASRADDSRRSASGAQHPKHPGQPTLRSCNSSHDLTNASSNSSTAHGKSQVSVIRRSSSCGSLGYDCSVVPQLPTLHASGTAAYTAPEVVAAAFSNSSVADVVGPQNDVWSLAVLLLECLTGHHPFGDPTMSPGAFMCNIFSKTQAQINACINALHVSQACKNWLQLGLTIDTQQRPTAEQLLQHSWITGASNSSSTCGQGRQQHQIQVQEVVSQQQQQQQSLFENASHAGQPKASAAPRSCMQGPPERACHPSPGSVGPATVVHITAGDWELQSLSNAALSSCSSGLGRQQASCVWDGTAAAAAACTGSGVGARPFRGSSGTSACGHQQLAASTQFSCMESICSWED